MNRCVVAVFESVNDTLGVPVRSRNDNIFNAYGSITALFVVLSGIPAILSVRDRARW